MRPPLPPLQPPSRRFLADPSHEFWDARHRTPENTERFLMLNRKTETAEVLRDFLRLLGESDVGIPTGPFDSNAFAFRLRSLFQFMHDWGCVKHLRIASMFLRNHFMAADNLHPTTGITVGALIDCPELVGDTLAKYGNVTYADIGPPFAFSDGRVPGANAFVLDPHWHPFASVGNMPKIYIYALTVAWARASAGSCVDVPKLVETYWAAIGEAKSESRDRDVLIAETLARHTHGESHFADVDFMPRRRRAPPPQESVAGTPVVAIAQAHAQDQMRQEEARRRKAEAEAQRPAGKEGKKKQKGKGKAKANED